MKTSAGMEKKKPPFVYKYFNVSTFTTNPLSDMEDVLARLINCFIKELNDNIYLPSLLVMIPDHDLLNYVANYFSNDTRLDSTDLRNAFGKAIQWLASQLDRAIEIRKDALHIRHNGAVDPLEPRILWIKVLGWLKSRQEVLDKYIYNSVCGPDSFSLSSVLARTLETALRLIRCSRSFTHCVFHRISVSSQI